MAGLAAFSFAFSLDFARIESARDFRGVLGALAGLGAGAAAAGLGDMFSRKEFDTVVLKAGFALGVVPLAADLGAGLGAVVLRAALDTVVLAPRDFLLFSSSFICRRIRLECPVLGHS